MTDCILCKVKEKIYEDNIAIALLGTATQGHIILTTKKHYQILEQVPDWEISHLLNIANKLSIVVFETMKAQGTNIIIQNGVPAGQTIPHFAIHIIPRTENDNMNLLWKAKQMTQEQMSTIELKMKQAEIGPFQKTKPEEKIIKLEEKKPEIIKKAKQGINYLIKQLQRIP